MLPLPSPTGRGREEPSWSMASLKNSPQCWLLSPGQCVSLIQASANQRTGCSSLLPGSCKKQP